MPPNLVIGTHLKPFEDLNCKAWVDLGERSRRFWENVGLVLDNGIGFGQALECSWRSGLWLIVGMNMHFIHANPFERGAGVHIYLSSWRWATYMFY
jgi:hypothetical protein